jgi:hypothetical protein
MTNAGTWSFSTTTNSSGNLILLNGQSAAGGSATELEVANGGNLYADNAQGQWWEWNGSGWASSTNPSAALATAGLTHPNVLHPSIPGFFSSSTKIDAGLFSSAANQPAFLTSHSFSG